MYLSSINWFRGFAIIFVVFSHLTIYPSTFESGYTSFFSYGTFYFVFISGFLFYYLREKFEYFSYLSRKVRYVVIPYIFISLPVLFWANYVIFTGGTWFHHDLIPSYEGHNLTPDYFSNVVYLNIYLLSTGGALLGPWWFIPMICIFFVSSYWTLKVSESKCIYSIFLLSFLFTLFSKRPDAVSPIISFFYWFSVYMLGLLAAKNYSMLMKNSQKIVLVSFTLLVGFQFIELDVDVINMFHIRSLLVTFFVLSLFYLVEKKQVKLIPLDILAKYSFGIFFLHKYFIQIQDRIIVPKFGLEKDQILFFGTGCLAIMLSIMTVKVGSIFLERLKLNPRYFFGV